MICRDHGARAATRFMSDAQRVINQWLLGRGFSVGCARRGPDYARAAERRRARCLLAIPQRGRRAPHRRGRLKRLTPLIPFPLRPPPSPSNFFSYSGGKKSRRACRELIPSTWGAFAKKTTKPEVAPSKGERTPHSSAKNQRALFSAFRAFFSRKRLVFIHSVIPVGFAARGGSPRASCST